MDVNALLHIKSQEQVNEGIITGALSKTDDFIASTIVDTATSLWNSVVDLPSFFLPQSLEPDTSDYRIETYDVLKRVNDDWANYFEENKDLVHTASFVAGIVLPGGAALKGMKYLRSGKFDFYPEAFTSVRAEKDLVTLSKMLEEGKQATREFKDMRRNMYIKMVGNEFADSIAMEGAVLGAMSEHPFMEDYMKDPWSNFALWAGVGGVLGAGVGAIVKNAEIANKLKDVYTEVQNIVTDPSVLKRVDIPSLPTADLAQRNFYNAKIMEDIANNTEYNQLTREYANRFLLAYQADGQKLLFDAIDTNIKEFEGITKQQRAELVNSVQDILKKEGSVGVDRVAFMDVQSVTNIDKKQKALPEADILKQNLLSERFGNLARYTANSSELAKHLPDYAKLLEKLTENTYVGYSPVFQSFVPKEMSWALQTAADLGQKARSINVTTTFKDADDLFLRQGKEGNPAFVHQRYIDALSSVSKLNIQHVPKEISIHMNDLPVMNAWISRASELVQAGKEPVFKITTKKGPQEFSIDQLASFLSQRKEALIKELTSVGASIHEIATRLDMSPRIIEAHLFEKLPLQSFDNWRTTVDATRIGEYLDPKKKMLKMIVDPKKKNILQTRNTAQMASNLDEKMLNNFHKQIMEEQVIRNESTTAQGIYKALEANSTMWDMVRQRVGEINQESVGNLFMASTDQALRRLGDLGTIITQSAKDVFGVVNRVSQEQLTQLSLLTKTINDNVIFRQEFAEVVNTLAGIPGYRFMKDDGTLMVREPVLDALGHKVAGKFNERAIMKTTGEPLVVKHEANRMWLREMQKVGAEQRKLNNTIRGVQGANPLNDIGLWIPSFNPINKYISYVIDPTAPVGMQTRVLVANDPAGLASLEQQWKKGEGVNNPHMKLITKSEQEDYNKIQNMLDPISMDYVDVALKHSGASKQAITPDAAELLSTTIQNLHDRFLWGTRKMVSLYLSDIMHQLDMMSTVNRKFTDAQPTRGITRIINKSEDSAAKVKNILLGESTLGQYGTWQVFNNSVKLLLEKAVSSVNTLTKKHLDFDNLGAPRKKDYTKLTQDMEAAGIVNPFKTYDEFLTARNTEAAKPINSLYAQHMRAKAEGKKSSADSIIAATNGVMATLALRVAELAHPIVNALSLPILSNGNLMARMPQTFLGIKLGAEQQGGMSFATKMIYDGVRGRFSPKLASVMKEFQDEGFVAPIVSEATEVLRLVHSGENNAAAKINKLLDSGVVKKLSIAADTVETETRAISLMTGYMTAKQAYPGITHEGAKLFAKQFMDRVIGNYHSFQRPALFQGTFGVAIGLFQTYMLTMAQSIYRNIEAKDFKALSATMLTQAGMFGMSSLPFYDISSKFIGEHMSDDHYDITTGTYRALGDPLAEFVLYGLPSNIGTVVGNALGIESLTKAKGLSLYTRGDLQPRLPFITSNPGEQLVVVNALMQAYGTATHITDKIKKAEGAAQIGQALVEGLSMQSISRPLARGAELISGYSVSRLGNTIQGPEDIWTVAGVGSRLLASRTTEEQIKRHADHLNSYYGAIDYENRQQATEAIKQAIRSGSLTDETMSKIAYEYMRTGTPTGWRAALNAAIAGTEGGIDYKFMRLLKPDSPLNLMIRDL